MTQTLENSCFVEYLNFAALTRHLLLLPEVIKSFDPVIHKVTTVHTVYDAMNSNAVYKQVLSEVHKALPLYLTISCSDYSNIRTVFFCTKTFTYLL